MNLLFLHCHHVYNTKHSHRYWLKILHCGINYLIYNLKQLFTSVNVFSTLLEAAKDFSSNFVEDSFEGVITFCTLCFQENNSSPDQSSNNSNPNPTNTNISPTDYTAPTFLYLFTPLHNFNINIGELCSWRTNIINVSLEIWIKKMQLDYLLRI